MTGFGKRAQIHKMENKSSQRFIKYVHIHIHIFFYLFIYSYSFHILSQRFIKSGTDWQKQHKDMKSPGIIEEWLLYTPYKFQRDLAFSYVATYN